MGRKAEKRAETFARVSEEFNIGPHAMYAMPDSELAGLLMRTGVPSVYLPHLHTQVGEWLDGMAGK